MPKQVFSNNAKTSLATDITDAFLNIAVDSGTAALFVDSNGNGDWELATIDDGVNIEIVKITNLNAGTDTLTIERAHEGSTAQAFLAGSIIRASVTKGTLELFQNNLTAVSDDINNNLLNSVLTQGGNVLVGSDGNLITG